MRYLLALTLLWIVGFVSAQRFAFVNYNTAQGLPQSQVTAVTQDPKGALWVGTLGGLARFNGKDFTGYTNENGLLNNRITCLYSAESALWVGHEGGVSCIQGKKISKWSFGKERRSISVSDILPFGNELLVATNGEGLFRLVNGKFYRVAFSVSPLYVTEGKGSLALNTVNEDLLKIRDLHLVGKKMYLATRAGVLVTEDLKNFKTLPAIEGLSISSLQSNRNALYVTTRWACRATSSRASPTRSGAAGARRSTRRRSARQASTRRRRASRSRSGSRASWSACHATCRSMSAASSSRAAASTRSCRSSTPRWRGARSSSGTRTTSTRSAS